MIIKNLNSSMAVRYLNTTPASMNLEQKRYLTPSPRNPPPPKQKTKKNLRKKKKSKHTNTEMIVLIDGNVI